MALDGLTPDEIVKQELATGIPIVYRLREDSSVVSKDVLG
jgi:2,3-bisphosphoglycerate-dependent phosphoglycerate mutase